MRSNFEKGSVTKAVIESYHRCKNTWTAIDAKWAADAVAAWQKRQLLVLGFKSDGAQGRGREKIKLRGVKKLQATCTVGKLDSLPELMHLLHSPSAHQACAPQCPACCTWLCLFVLKAMCAVGKLDSLPGLLHLPHSPSAHQACVLQGPACSICTHTSPARSRHRGSGAFCSMLSVKLCYSKVVAR